MIEHNPALIDAYIKEQPESVQEILSKVRDAIKEVLPNAKERITWRMPTFWDGHNIIHFAAFKNHLGIYPGSEAIVFFKEELKDYKTSKGAIQFPYSKDVPYELIKKIALWCYETNNYHGSK